ncbi:MAG: hypothetical protein CSA70_03710 [Rhodobacterales bacterium]|nr:MAG: hypothetical protein CSA70_03710 [Rhodobacterales bacterium]
MLELRTNDGGFVYASDTAAALNMGLSVEAIQAAEAEARKTAVSEECRRRIFAVASQNAQTNMSLAVGVIGAKTASTRTDIEKATLAGAEAALGWVMDMRAAFLALAADAQADYLADAAWPAIPPEAATIAAQF